MDKDEFSRRWRRLKTPEEKQRFLANELNSELGPFDAFRNRLPTVRVWAPAYLEEYPYMRNNNLNAQLTQRAMFGDKRRNNQSSIVNKIVEEMSNIPTLIEAFNPSTSQILKTGENGIKKPKSSNDYHRKSEQNPSIKPKPQVENYRNHTALKASTSDEQHFNKSTRPDRQSPQKSNHRHSPTHNKHKLDNSTEARAAKQQRLDPHQFASTSTAPIPKIELSYISPLRRPESLSRPASRRRSSNSLFACKFPDYAIGEYYGYRVGKIKNNKAQNLPDSIVSINIRKMPNIKELMTHIKNHVRKAPKLNHLKNSDLLRALYMSGLMLYVVQKASASILNDLLREILSIISIIRSTFLDPSSPCSRSKHFTIATNMLHLADSYFCERLYENTLEFACKRRELMSRCQSTFTSFDNKDILVPANFGTLLQIKDQEMFASILSDLCAHDKVDIPKLYYHLLSENSQHSMLHEKHIYSKRLCIQQMEKLEPALWKRLTIVMKLQLDKNSCTDIADAIFSLIYWLNNQEKG